MIMANQDRPFNPIVIAAALLTGVAVPFFGEFKGLISVVQACAATSTVFCVWWYPLSAIPIYLFGYQVPYYFINRAPITYPGAVLSIAIVVSLLLPRRQQTGIPLSARQIFALLGCLFCLSAASSLWGNDWISIDVTLGFIFVLGTFWMLRNERDWWIGISMLGMAEVMVALALFRHGQAEAYQAGEMVHERGEMTGDPNYASFLIGLAITTAWCVAMQGCSYLKSRRRLVAGLKVLAILITAGGLYSLVHFQSRGLSAAVVGALAASMLHLRKGFKGLLIGGLAAGLLFAVVWQTPAFEGLMERWSNKSELSDGNDRLTIWKWVFEQWQEGPLLNKVLGFGSAAEIEKAGAAIRSSRLSEVSTHNTFVRFFLDQGVVGAALFFCVLALCARCAWRRKDDMGNIRFSLLVYLTLAGLSIEPQRDPVFWISLGLCLPVGDADWVRARSRPHLAFSWWRTRSAFRGSVQPLLERDPTSASRLKIASRGRFPPSRLAIACASRKARYLGHFRK